jgi:hypothetical protein
MRRRPIFPLGLPLILAIGCGSTQRPPVAAPSASAPVRDAPAWVDNEEIPDGLGAVGIAQANAMGDKGFQRTVALADARTKLAGKLKVRVQHLFSQLNQQVTTAGQTTGQKLVRSEVMNRVIESVARQLVDQTLVNAITRSTWTDTQDGSLYLFLVMSRDALAESLAQSAKVEIRREVAKGEAHQLAPVLPKVEAAAATTAGDTEAQINADLDKLDPSKP